VTTRSYNQHCGIARALDLVGERWALLVLRELVLGPQRFTDLREGLPGIATNVLSQRLRQLERDGIVTRRRLPPPAASTVYELTDYGQDLVPIMLDLGRWGARSMGPREPEQTRRGRWFAVAMKAFHDPKAAADVKAIVAVDLGDAQVTLRLDRGQLEVVPGLDDEAELSITADSDTLVAYLSGAVDAVDAEGNRELLERLREIFPFPARELLVGEHVANP
jgi:DNA-binding HxlR family transcriptional regulator